MVPCSCLRMLQSVSNRQILHIVNFEEFWPFLRDLPWSPKLVCGNALPVLFPDELFDTAVHADNKLHDDVDYTFDNQCCNEGTDEEEKIMKLEIGMHQEKLLSKLFLRDLPNHSAVLHCLRSFPAPTSWPWCLLLICSCFWSSFSSPFPRRPVPHPRRHHPLRCPLDDVHLLPLGVEAGGEDVHSPGPFPLGNGGWLLSLMYP